MQHTPISADELKRIAWILVDRHGKLAFELAGEAIAEMRDQGDEKRIHAWLALQSVIDDALCGRIHKQIPLTLH